MRKFTILCSLPLEVHGDDYLTWEEFQDLYPSIANEYRQFCKTIVEDSDLTEEEIDLCTNPDFDSDDRQFFWVITGPNGIERIHRYFWSDPHDHYWHHYLNGEWFIDCDIDGIDVWYEMGEGK